MASNEKAIAYMNVKNGKYALQNDSGYGTPVDFKYLKSVPLNTEIGDTPIYADGIKLGTVVSDTGYTGDIGTTAQDRDFEKAIGQAMDGNGSYLMTNINGYQKVAFYFETEELTASGVPYTAKHWMFGVEVGKPNLAHNTNTNTPAVGEIAYPSKVTGAKVMAATGDSVYVDENGMERMCYIMTALPGVTGYETFGASVPSPKVAAAE